MIDKPKICVSITGRTKKEVLEQAETFSGYEVEMIEWRIDFFEGIADITEVLNVVALLKRKISVELIVTLRTEAEGGEKIPEEVSYREVLSEIISQGEADYVDIEVYRGECESIQSLFELAEDMRMKTIGSYHDFKKMPSAGDMVLKLLYMKKLGATIGKMAAMSNSSEDTSILLKATDTMKASYPKFPIIMMAMGKHGKESRIYGGLYGSCVTFGYIGTSSAPGQIPVKELRKNLDALYSGKRHIILIGFMGVGKTMISDELAKRTGKNAVDTDQIIAMMEGRSIEDIFSVEGEAYFRELESKSIDRLGGASPCIVSCGGGMVLREINVRKLRAIGTIVLLTAEPSTIFDRVKGSNDRPILNGNMNEEYIRTLMDERRPCYEAAAEIVISTDGKEISVVVEEILKEIK